MNNMYNYLVYGNRGFRKQASSPSRNVYNVLRKVAEDDTNPIGDEEEITKAMDRAESGAIKIPHYYYLDENNNFDPSPIRAWKRMIVDTASKGLDWVKNHGEDLGYIGGGMGLGAGIGALSAPKNRILGALLGGAIGGGAGYGTKAFMDSSYGKATKDWIKGLFSKAPEGLGGLGAAAAAAGTNAFK